VTSSHTSSPGTIFSVQSFACLLIQLGKMHVTPTLMAALPEVKTLRDCADFERTVLPFIPQLKQLPSRILHATSLVELKNVYLETNPVMSALAFSIIIAQAVFVVSQINKNYSQIDRLWSILPAFYNYHFWGWAYLHGIRSRKLDMVVVLSFIWSVSDLSSCRSCSGNSYIIYNRRD